MLHYVALAILLSCVSSGIVSSAAGNIGCLFSETLCNQEKEWCNDDNAFGKCLPLYGNVRERDMHRYNLGTEELHVLELEMQRLFLLGYRWSHTYTQCVLQALLSAIRHKSEFNISDCNDELDQDLEGALKAIEGEEMEHVDARDLAIVRFTPSALNPHSDYADELYYPPLDELLSPLIEKSKENQENNSEEEPSQMKQKLLQSKQNVFPSMVPIGNEDLRGRKGQVNDVKTSSKNLDRVSNNIKDHLSLPPPALHQPYYHDNEPSPSDSDDYDYDLRYDITPYDLPMNQMYKRNPYNARPSSFGNVENFYRGPVKSNDLKKLTFILNHLGDKLNPVDILPHHKIDAAENQGVFQEMPIISSYRERFPLFMNDKNSVYAPYNNEYQLRGSPYTSDLPELDLPKEDDQVSDTIHAGFVKEFEEENYQNDQANNNLRSPSVEKDNEYFKDLYQRKYGMYHYDPVKSSYNDNSVTRFEKEKERKYDLKNYQKPTVEHNAYQWQNNVNNDQNNYRTFKNSQPGYGDQMNMMSYGGRSSVLPMDLYYRTPNIPYNYDYYNTPAYYDYGETLPDSNSLHFTPEVSKKDIEQLADYTDMDVNGRSSLPGDDRHDVKKPGPYFSSQNSFPDYSEDFLNYPYGGDHEWINKLEPGDGNGLMNKMSERTVSEGDHHSGSHNSDLLLSDKGYVKEGEVVPRRRIIEGPKTAPRVSNEKKKHRDINEKVQSDSYVYINISRNFTSPHQAVQLVLVILKEIKLDRDIIENIREENNVVRFEVKKNNSRGMTAARLAELTEEKKDVINSKLEMKIVQSSVGNKSGITAVVYSAGRDRQLYTAAAIVCGIFAAILVAATALYLLRQNTKSKAKLEGLTAHDSEATKDYQDLCRSRMSAKAEVKETTGPGHAHPVSGSNWSSHAPSQRISSLSKESDNGNKSPSSRSSTSSWSEEPVISNMDISTGHMVLSYMEDHLENKDRLEQEWVALCAYEAEPCSCKLALQPENAVKNRYPDVTPYDHNRVIVNDHTNVNGSNYVNASSITDHDPRNPAYISTQGPLASTAADFWQLVWEQGSVVIVMLTRLTENGQSLCYRYWPEEGNELYHIYEVNLVSEHVWCDDYLVRSFYLKNALTGETRTVTQFHFLSWPESGIPASTKALLEFRRKVNKSYRGRSCPIVVHCSDGVGRAGTYCLIDMVLNRMAKGTKEIDIAATLEHIRDQRPNMVKTKTQFEFVLMTVAEEVHAILKALPQ